MDHFFSSLVFQPFGIIACLIQLAITLLGLPHQIYITYKSKQANTVSLPLFLLCWLGSSSCAMHIGTEAWDIYLFLPQIPAIIFGGIIIWQIFHYRRSHATSLGK